MMKFKGIIPPVSSTFLPDGSVDEKGMANVADYLINSGVHGLFYLGSGGEFSQMNGQERKHLAECAVRIVNHRVPVLIGVGSTNSREAIELTRHAESIGASAVVAINPYYWKVSHSNLIRYFTDIAHATTLPVIIYNFPQLTGQDMTPDIIKELLQECSNIMGIKDTIDSVNHLRSMINEIKPIKSDFSVFCGYDDHLLNNLLLGGDGSITASVNFAPELSIGIYDAYIKGDYSTAMKLHKRLIQLPGIYSMATPFIALIKEAMLLKGIDLNPYCLPPTAPISADMKIQLRNFLIKHQIID